LRDKAEDNKQTSGKVTLVWGDQAVAVGE